MQLQTVNKDKFLVCYITTHQSLNVGYQTSVDCQAKFFVLACKITWIIVEAAIDQGNIALCSSKISRETSQNIANFGLNFCANSRAKVWENKEGNSRLSFALLYNNTVICQCFDFSASFLITQTKVCFSSLRQYGPAASIIIIIIIIIIIYVLSLSQIWPCS